MHFAAVQCMCAGWACSHSCINFMQSPTKVVLTPPNTSGNHSLALRAELCRLPHYCPVAAYQDWGLDGLVEMIWQYLRLIRVYTKPKVRLLAKRVHGHKELVM